MIEFDPSSGIENALEAARVLLAGAGDDGVDLYRRWYHELTMRLVSWPNAAAYRAAVADPTRLESGWVVIAPAEAGVGSVLVGRDGRQRSVAPPELVPEAAHLLAPAPGHYLMIDPLMNAESGGFWHVWSAGWQMDEPPVIERLYFRLRPERSLKFARRLVKSLPPRRAWATKILTGEHDAGRRDDALLYVPTGATASASWVNGAIDAVAELCDGTLPPFVRTLRRGVGWAPDPGNGASFGEAICAAVASSAAAASDRAVFHADVVARVGAIRGMAGWSAELVGQSRGGGSNEALRR